MHEIKIYGYISNVADQSGKEVSLIEVQNQLSLAEGKDILCRINSYGGDAEEGFAIYYELRRYAEKNNARIKTFAESRLGSIATIIFLAGDDRELTTDLQPFVHKALFETEDDLTDAQKNTLEVLNSRLAKHYESHTDLTFDEAMELMNNDTWISTETALSMRFATSIEQVLRPVALQRFNNNQLNPDMNKNKKTPNILAKAEAFLKSVGLIAVNKLVNAADETEIDFYELAEDDNVEVGAKARIDGKDAEGSYVMKSGETYVFVAGELTEIVAADAGSDDETIEAMQATIDSLTEQLETVTNKAVELEATNKANVAIIAKYKGAGSQPAPNDTKQKPANTPAAENKAAAATTNFIKNNLLKTK